jgi:hypothetical protein
MPTKRYADLKRNFLNYRSCLVSRDDTLSALLEM